MIFLRFSVLLAAVCVSVPTFAADPAPDAVARLGSTDISASALQSLVRSLDPATRKQAINDPTVMARLVRGELARIAVVKQAEAAKWDKRPDVIDEIRRVRDEAVAASFLKSVSAPPADYPSEAEIKSAYELNRDALMAPRQYRLSQIFVASPAGNDAPAKQKADDIARKARVKGTDFDALAKASSDAGTGEQVGDLGWAEEPQILPEIRTQLAGMALGEVSDPIRTKSGWHIIRLTDTKPAAPRALSDVHDALVAALRQRKAQENEQAYVAALLAKTPISVNEARFRQLLQNTQ